MPFAHLCQDKAPHLLLDHLQAVARMAKENAAIFQDAGWAELVGLWHDLGKYNPAWQRYLHSAAGNAEDAHLESVASRGPNHSSAGALHALAWLRAQSVPEKIARVIATLLAYPIMGHHAGLADYDGGGGSLSRRLLAPDEDHLALALRGAMPQDVLSPPHTPDLKTLCAMLHQPGRDIGFFIRMVFSCVVDADFLDTEAYMRPDLMRGSHPSMDMLRVQLHAHLVKLDKADNAVNAARAEVLAACVQRAKETPGCFSLIVPTGGGKTLSSLAFALEHAAAHNKRRVIYAIPYTSIIEQTAATFRRVFEQNPDAVIEHHSNVSDGAGEKDTSRQRLASENWDAPVIVTTTVQLFESLYAAKTGRCRKLHAIADSVVILDEAHLMPPGLRTPILHALHQLARFYGVSVVFCTATPTGLEAMKHEGQYVTDMRAIIPDPEALYSQLERVSVEVRPEAERLAEWSPLANELACHTQALCIVSRRDDCRALHSLMPEGTIHLSALMCAEHRSRVIADIKKRLPSGEPLRVISTQLVEAGVDIDFPVVYRAMAGLDSLAQAAGRCNREGKLERGRVVVFYPPKEATRGLLKQAEQAAKNVIRQHPHDNILSPRMQRRYFEEFYGRCNGDEKGIMKLLSSNAQYQYQFRTAAEEFRMVEDKYRSIVVHYENDALLAQLGAGKPDRGQLRRAQRYVASIPESYHKKLEQEGAIKAILPNLYIQDTARAPDLYDPALGLKMDFTVGYATEDLVV